MNCPKCRTPSLRRMSVPRAARLPRMPAVCDGCSGVWVRLDVVPRLLEDDDLRGRLDDAATAQEGVDRRGGLCPEGHGILARTRIGLDAPDDPVDPEGGSFFLDRCLTCDGLWLDAGEWRRLAQSHLLAALPHLWTVPWQRQQRRDAAEAGYLKRSREHLGTSLFERLEELATELRGDPRRSEALAFLAERSRTAAAEESEE